MIIQVTGTGTSNKGAELLLVAVQQQLKTAFPNVQLAVSASFGDFTERARYGLRLVLPETPKRRWWLAGRLMPSVFREHLGLVMESDVDAVLDASGFAFGDQLGAKRVTEFAHNVQRWKRQGKPVILLPQALGPFENPEVRDAFGEVMQSADMVFARDDISFQHASRLISSGEKLRQSPDFTNLVQRPANDDLDERKFDSLLVPNFQMIAKGTAGRADQYVPFLARCYQQLEAQGLSVAVLLHDDRKDARLIDPLRRELKHDFVVTSERDPLRLKAILGTARLVVGSRFHALVGALSQGVPSVAAGWSHKYETLLAEYDSRDATLPVDADGREIGDLFGSIMGDWEARQAAVAAAAERLRESARQMWKVVILSLQSSVGAA